MNFDRTKILISLFGLCLLAQAPSLRAQTSAGKPSDLVRPLGGEPAARSGEPTQNPRTTAASLLQEIIKEFEDDPADATANRAELLEEVAKIVQRKLDDSHAAPAVATKLPLSPSSARSAPPKISDNTVSAASKPTVPRQLPSATPATGAIQVQPGSGGNTSTDASYVRPASNALSKNDSPTAAMSIEARLKRLEQDVNELKSLLQKQASTPSH